MQHGFTMATQSIGTTARILSGSWRCQASDRDCYTGAGVFLRGTRPHSFAASGGAPPLAGLRKQLRSSARVLAVTSDGAPRKQQQQQQQQRQQQRQQRQQQQRRQQQELLLFQGAAPFDFRPRGLLGESFFPYLVGGMRIPKSFMLSTYPAIPPYIITTLHIHRLWTAVDQFSSISRQISSRMCN